MYNITQSNLYKLQNKSKLYSILKTNKSTVKFFLTNKNHYNFIKKEKTKERLITAPKQELKKVLKNLDKYIKRIEMPSYVMSSRTGVSSIDNAHKHSKNPFVLTLDIANFYPSIQQEYIFRFFKYKLKQSDDVAWTLTKLTTIPTKDGLPQGFPPSSKLAFWAYKDMFDKIDILSKRYDITFTLYVDDLTFSNTNKIPDIFYKDVCNILNAYDFAVKLSKTKKFGILSHKHITGVVIADNTLQMPNEKFKKFRLILKAYNKMTDKAQGLLSYNKNINKYNN